jgi:HEAT repeat protein
MSEDSVCDWPFLAEMTLMMTIGQPDLLIRKLIEKLHDADPITRRNATGALRLQGPPAAVAIPAITELLADEDARVRCEAERAIEYLTLVAA